jgi:hypothetical protein
MKRTLLLLALAVGLVLFTAPPAAAGEPLFAAKSAVRKYWDGFKDYWGGAFKSKSAVTMIVLGTGALGLFIITRGKWRK